ncbi:hypothetical protein [Sagittula sp. S175]|uniref:hypothetical protein n=1 Tax=Sagittula sp. S175 TaxID=3415129 RepID=UPI003C7BD336
MVKIDEINNRKKLEAWLNALPQGTEAEQAEARRIAVSVAARAAARVLPVWWRFAAEDPVARQRNLTALPILRSLSISSVASKRPTEEIGAAAIAAESAAKAVVINSATLFAAKSSVKAVRAASWIGLAETASAAHAADDAAAAIFADTPSGTSAVAAGWESLKNDLLCLIAGGDVFAAPLWNGDNPLSEAWRNVKAIVTAGEAAADWAFWLWWYEGVLTGTAPDPASPLMVEIATSKEIDWEDVPKALTAINAICERHGGAKGEQPAPEAEADRAERAGAAAGKRVVDQVRHTVGENRKEIPATLEALQQLIVLEIERWQGNNFLNAEHPDLCRQQLHTFLVMYEALERMAPLIPVEGLPTVAEAEKIVGLGQLYRDKFAALPREKADEIVAAVWESGGAAVNMGMVFGTTVLLGQIGVPQEVGVAVGALAFGRKQAGEIIKAAKDHILPKPGA